MVTTEETLDRASASVADIALHFPRALEVLNKYNLDYCCNGKNKFEEVCKKSNLDPDQVWLELQQTKRKSGIERNMRFETWDLAPLIAFACSTYQLSFKMLKEFDNDLMQHIHLENNILFPKAELMNA